MVGSLSTDVIPLRSESQRVMKLNITLSINSKGIISFVEKEGGGGGGASFDR